MAWQQPSTLNKMDTGHFLYPSGLTVVLYPSGLTVVVTYLVTVIIGNGNCKWLKGVVCNDLLSFIYSLQPKNPSAMPIFYSICHAFFPYVYSSHKNKAWNTPDCSFLLYRRPPTVHIPLARAMPILFQIAPNYSHEKTLSMFIRYH